MAKYDYSLIMRNEGNFKNNNLEIKMSYLKVDKSNLIIDSVRFYIDDELKFKNYHTR
jgi:hypothetical protein